MEMIVPPVDENLYVKSLQNRDIPNDTQCTTFDSQNSKTKQPDPRLSKSNKQNSKAVRPTQVPPRCSSLKDNNE